MHKTDEMSMTGEKPVSAKNIRHTVGKKLNGPGYLLEGFQLLFHPRLRLLVLTPLVINLWADWHIWNGNGKMT